MSGVTSALCIVAMFKSFIYRISYFVDYAHDQAPYQISHS